MKLLNFDTVLIRFLTTVRNIPYTWKRVWFSYITWQHINYLHWGELLWIQTPCSYSPANIRFCTGDLNQIQTIQQKNIKKVNFTGAIWFSSGELSQNIQSKYLDHFQYHLCLKKYRDSIKRVVTLAKIQSARTFHNLTLMENCQKSIVTCLCHTFPSKVQFFYVCVRVLRVVAVA